jgi:ribonucleoside-diphosphate reductase alpha chain
MERVLKTVSKSSEARAGKNSKKCPAKLINAQIKSVVQSEFVDMRNTSFEISPAQLALRKERTPDEEKAIREIFGGRSTDLPITANAAKVFSKRYCGIEELPEEMFARVSEALARPERLYYGATKIQEREYAERFFRVMSDFKFIPAGRTLKNAGSHTDVVPNCIVLHPKDSMLGIGQTMCDAGVLQQAGSGLGFPWHLLRPAGFKAKTTDGVAGGPVCFMHAYNAFFASIQQQNRHGANMGILRVDHPDILEFVHCKAEEGKISNFNISVGLIDEFMRLVDSKDPRPWKCVWGGKEYYPRRINRDRECRMTGIEPVFGMSAYDLFKNEIAMAAWKNGEPGCIFPDTINKTNPLPGLGRLEACNPCGEQNLHDGDVCNLGSINAEAHIIGDFWDQKVKSRTEVRVDYVDLENTVRLAVRMLDNVIDITKAPVDRVREMIKGNRRIGIGVMGLADAAIKLGISYGSPEFIDWVGKFMKFINDTANDESMKIAEQKGVFDNYDKSIYKEKGIIRRNAATTNVPPTGTTSMLLDISGGV